MNTNPDETTLALWLEDELTGAELAAMDAWAADMPEQAKLCLRHLPPTGQSAHGRRAGSQTRTVPLKHLGPQDHPPCQGAFAE